MTARRPSTEGSVQGGAAWLVSMTDLVSILLCFFIMLFSMSSVDTDQWRGLASADTADGDPIVDDLASEPAAEFPVPRANFTSGTDLGYLAAIIAGKFAADPLLRSATLEQSEKGLTISLPGKLLFDGGSAEPASSARDALVRLSSILSMLNNRIEILSSGDGVRMSNGIFTSNWELGLARAGAVAGILSKAGYDRAITAFGQADTSGVGYGDSRAGPERQDFARFVDIVICPNGAEAQP